MNINGQYLVAQRVRTPPVELLISSFIRVRRVSLFGDFFTNLVISYAVSSKSLICGMVLMVSCTERFNEWPKQCIYIALAFSFRTLVFKPFRAPLHTSSTDLYGKKACHPISAPSRFAMNRIGSRQHPKMDDSISR